MERSSPSPPRGDWLWLRACSEITTWHSDRVMGKLNISHFWRHGAKFSHGVSDETPPGFKRSTSLDTTACLELVSPSVTQFQSSLFLWVVAASALPTLRNSISALLGLLNLLLSTLPQCPTAGTWDGFIHFHRNFPQPTVPPHSSFSCTTCLHSSFPSTLSKSTPLTSFPPVVLSQFPSPKHPGSSCGCTILHRHLVSPYIFRISQTILQ